MTFTMLWIPITPYTPSGESQEICHEDQMEKTDTDMG
jgi:hypothetical protein